ncbi:MAG: glycerophosphodiester phosphodiesterase [Longimicrobiales bacterium]
MATSELKPLHPVLRGGPLLIAHRGGAGLAPENTLFAFRRAEELWRADMIELDVHASADGHGVVIHDPTLERTTNGSGPVASRTLAQLQALDAGYQFTLDGGRSYPFRGQGIRIPTIVEVLQALPAMRLTVEVKTAAAQRPLFAAIEQAAASQRVIAAGEFRDYRTEFAGYPGCLSTAREDATLFYVFHRLRLSFLAPVRAQVMQICEFLGERRVLTPRLVAELRRRGVPAHVWTVNDAEDMNRLLDWGVDGILTDRPDRLAHVLHERLGRPLPPGVTHAGASPGSAS